MKQEKPKPNKRKKNHDARVVMTTDDRIKNLPDFKDRLFDPTEAWVNAIKSIKK